MKCEYAYSGDEEEEQDETQMHTDRIDKNSVCICVHPCFQFPIPPRSRRLPDGPALTTSHTKLPEPTGQCLRGLWL